MGTLSLIAANVFGQVYGAHIPIWEIERVLGEDPEYTYEWTQFKSII